MGEAFTWAVANVDSILVAVLAVHAAALAIVNLTPTPKDDEIVAKAYKVVEFVAGFVTKKAKQ